MNIATITLNPAVDITYCLAHLELGAINRADVVMREAGGKGLNVAKVLQYLGANPICLGFIGGALGNQLATLMQEHHLNNAMTRIADETRACLNFLTNEHHTEVLEKGPCISTIEATQFLSSFTSLVKSQKISYATISGSLPVGLPADFYAQIIHLAKQHQVAIAIDSSGSALRQALNAQPDILKININEFMSALNLTNNDEKTLITAMQQLSDIPTIVITLGESGALAKHNNQLYCLKHQPLGHILNATGSGDSVLAGLIYALSTSEPIEEALKLSIACGMENTQHLAAGKIYQPNLLALQRNVDIERL